MLPALRQELQLFAAPKGQDGAPAWSLLDPVRNLYFRIDWLSFEILSRWHLGSPASIVDAIRHETTIDASEGDVKQLGAFLLSNELVKQTSAEQTEKLASQHQLRQKSPAQWLLHHYLFFRVPLWRPDRWLSRYRALTNFFYHPYFHVITLAVLVLSLFEVSRQWDDFTHAFVDLFSWQGLLGYSATLVFVKVLHEFGHAFTAKRYGCKVPVMGVAFLVMFPMAYTDVNDVWQLRERRKRLAVGAAGIATELMVAVWASAAWCLLPPGVLRSMAFLLSTTTWISSIAINASPFMRFDGYFLVMDWLNMPNLHQRAFDVARCAVRQTLFGIKQALPEPLTAGRYRALMAFALTTWIYRLVVFVGIAVLVYHAFPKPLGPLLGAIEVIWFIIMPVWKEVKTWRALLIPATRRWRFWLSASLLICILLILALPWDQRVEMTGVLKPAQAYSVIAPESARMERLAALDGDAVSQDQVLLKLSSKDLEFRAQQLDTQLKTIDWYYQSAGANKRSREQYRVTAAERDTLKAQRQEVSSAIDKLTPSANATGTFYLSDPDIHTGMYFKKSEQVGTVIDTTQWQVTAYVNEAQLTRIAVGNLGKFYPDTAGQPVINLSIEAISINAAPTLADGILSTQAGGLIPVSRQSANLTPERAIYRVKLKLTEHGQYVRPLLQRGKVVVYGQAQAYADAFLQSATSVFYRESGF